MNDEEAAIRNHIQYMRREFRKMAYRLALQEATQMTHRERDAQLRFFVQVCLDISREDIKGEYMDMDDIPF